MEIYFNLKINNEIKEFSIYLVNKNYIIIQNDMNEYIHVSLDNFNKILNDDYIDSRVKEELDLNDNRFNSLQLLTWQDN